MTQTSHDIQLNGSQVTFSTKFLEDITIHKRKGLGPFSKDQIQTISQLMQLNPSINIHRLILNSLQLDMAYAVFELLPANLQDQCLSSITNNRLLHHIFQQMNADQKNELLKTLYQTNRPKYMFLKQFQDNKLQNLGGVIVQQASPLTAFIQKEVHRLLDIIEDPKTRLKQCTQSASQLIDQYDLDDIDQLAQTLIKEYAKLEIGHQSPKTFAIHLRFYFFITPFIEKLPSLESDLTPLLDEFIQSLTKLPSPDWVVRIMNQLPGYFIRLLISYFAAFDSIPQIDKRNMYCKLYKHIREHASIKDGENVKFFLNQF